MAKQNPKLHKNRLIEAMIKFHGNVTKSCEVVGISRNQYYIYYNTDPVFKKEIDDIDELNLDFVEYKLFENIKLFNTIKNINFFTFSISYLLFF